MWPGKGAVESSSRTKIHPRSHDETTRIILHFDYDCFYAQVRENQNPALRSLPLGIKQKNILATCNYVARARGVTKLSIVAEARKICPDLVTVDGEDLSDFRDVSKKLFGLLRGYSWSGQAERLGLDEVWMDVTDIVDWNIGFLSRSNPASSWFCLVREDPEVGFEFDATTVAGGVFGDEVEDGAPLGIEGDGDLRMRLIFASHFARYLRLKIEEEGYTSACGIATNKTLAKLAGNVNKPRNQTTLLYNSPSSPVILEFMDSHRLRKVPGIGSKTTRILEDFIHNENVKASTAKVADGPTTDDPSDPPSITVHTIRTHPSASLTLLERLLSGPGTEKGIGEKVWNLLHGIDPSPVKAATDIPTQISIEDTYQGLKTLEEITRELHKLATSLLRRMHVDLLDDPPPPPTAGVNRRNSTAEDEVKRRWLAHPKTLRLATRPKLALTADTPYNFQRGTRSQPLPSFVFHLGTSPEAIIARLVPEYILPMFRHLNPDPPPGSTYNIGMLNVCVANMVPAASESAGGSGRDIAGMFARQGDVRREFMVYDAEDTKPSEEGEKPEEVEEDIDGWIEDEYAENGDAHMQELEDMDGDEEGDEWVGRSDAKRCALCGRMIPLFAFDAHQRYHQLGD